MFNFKVVGLALFSFSNGYSPVIVEIPAVKANLLEEMSDPAHASNLRLSV